MPRIKQTVVFSYDELEEDAQEWARDRYREHHLDYEWWEDTYEDIDKVSGFLGIDLRQTRVQLMNGASRYKPTIYFTGFGHQGQGSSYTARWQMSIVNRAALEEYLNLNDSANTVLKNILATFEAHKERYPDAEATVRSHRDTAISVEVQLGDRNIDNDLEYDTPLNALEFDSPKYRQLDAIEQTIVEAIKQALQDFNHWIFQRLEQEHEWLNSDEQVAESICANGYEFTSDGQLA